jgi:hypothetical protein
MTFTLELDDGRIERKLRRLGKWVRNLGISGINLNSS